jgi:hypothetical protein
MSIATIGSRRSLGTALVLVVGAFTGLLAVSRVSAQEDPATRELREAQRILEEKVRQAEELKARGRLDAAEATMKEAHDIKARIGAAKERISAREQMLGDRESLQRILEGLEQGMAALKQLDRPEEHYVLARVAEEVRARLPRDKPDRRQVLGERLELMRLALGALEEGDRKEAEIVSRAVRAIEVKLEGRSDERAHAILEQEPELAHQVECLRLAARLLKNYGHPEQARQVAALADEMWAPVEKRMDVGAASRVKAAGAVHQDELIQVIRKLEHRVAELEEWTRSHDSERRDR